METSRTWTDSARRFLRLGADAPQRGSVKLKPESRGRLVRFEAGWWRKKSPGPPARLSPPRGPPIMVDRHIHKNNRAPPHHDLTAPPLAPRPISPPRSNSPQTHQGTQGERGSPRAKISPTPSPAACPNTRGLVQATRRPSGSQTPDLFSKPVSQGGEAGVNRGIRAGEANW